MPCIRPEDRSDADIPHSSLEPQPPTSYGAVAGILLGTGLDCNDLNESVFFTCHPRRVEFSLKRA